MEENEQPWEFWADRGGTFTDVIGRRPDGRLLPVKVLSEDPLRPGDAIVRGMLAILGDSAGQARIRVLKVGTTVATNALLERRGAPTALAITRGFGDALLIGNQSRPELFALEIRRPAPLYGEVIEVYERLDAQGGVLEPLDEARLLDDLRSLHAGGARSLAICLLHGWLHPAHERRAGELAKQIGFTQVSLSHEVSPMLRLVERGDTTVADAYLSPVLDRHVAGLRKALDAAGLAVSELRFMQSSGGLASPASFRGSNSVLSGPAGGVAGMVSALAGPGRERLIGFDMGGTSTDIALWDGEFEVSSRNEIAGVRLNLPMLRVHTIAAGGGSVLHFTDGRFVVGPDSAGADPGPACYRRGGPLAVTDANLVLGRLVPAQFPRVFGTGSEALDCEGTQRQFSALAGSVSRVTGQARTAVEVAEGFLRVAVDNMAGAIRQVALRRGQDVRDFTLCCFGGAAGQVACLVAAELGIRRVQVHPLAGLLSAYGIGLAPLRALRQHSIERPLDDDMVAELPVLAAQLTRDCRAELAAQGVADSETRLRTLAGIRLAGSDSCLEIPVDDPAQLALSFRQRHEQVYGFRPECDGLVVATLRVEADGQAGDEGWLEQSRGTDTVTTTCQPLWSAGSWHQAIVLPAATLPPGQLLAGPAILTGEHTTIVVDPGWSARRDTRGVIELEAPPARAPSQDGHQAADPVLLEILNNRFMHVATEMGVVLEQTASSVNIKERLDFSCAVFDDAGRLIANAPHIPVHLGSMGESVRHVLACDQLQPGHAVLLNSPYAGGTHLPDMTMVSGLFDGSRLRYIVASRAHHTDIGGLTPGSMPARSQSIDQEGILFDGFILLRDGELDETGLLGLLGAGRFPARDPARNLADLRAQLAANGRGIAQLRAMLRQFGNETVDLYTRLIRENAAELVRRRIASLEGGRHELRLDGGERLAVRIAPDPSARRLLIDFTGSAAQSAGNLNAPAAVTRACVLYVLRCLLGKPVPLNEGCFEPIDIMIPHGSMLDPQAPAAVVGGNVETAQAVANLLFGALGLLAAGQGTMNNLSFGNRHSQYYETIGGGAGAGHGFDGASGIHTHMTNSRITDPEVLEMRLPVRVRAFGFHRGSGGSGFWRGGDGLHRSLEFLAPCTLSLLTGSRRIAPFGLSGGQPGRCGLNLLHRAGQATTTLPGICETEVAAGDVLEIRTPGGGGFGIPAS
ncbi:MAG: hydantoinase B/oxoprolinase family protein [Chromatiales bacterium]|nr:hydantoinase B/oxoprolinase family protein [Chromatiales bacterium]